jgi:transposase InsO family protein
MFYCLRVSKNAYYTWLRKPKDANSKPSLALLKGKIETIFYESNQIYGSLRIQKVLEKQNLYYSRSYIALLMKNLGLRSVLSKKFRVVTTDSNHTFPIANNVLDRDFTSENLGEKWVSDITYIRVGTQWNYLTTVLDLADRKVLSWVLSEDMSTENTVYKAWLEARKRREITNNHIFHSDRGVQYASNKMSLLLRYNTKITQSMSRKGNCWDNAVAESFFKTLKYECTNRYEFKSSDEILKIIKDYMFWYNNVRIHSSIDYKTPAEKELELKLKHYREVA